MGSSIRVLLADDTLIAREGWTKILETEEGIDVVGTAFTATDTLYKVDLLRPDVLLMDLNWFHDERAGAETIARIKQQIPQTKIIAITVYPELIPQARRVGADTALPKGFSKAELVETIRSIHRHTPLATPIPEPAPLTTPPTPLDHSHPARLAAAVGIPALGFIVIAAELMLGIRYLSVAQFTAAIVATMIVYFFGVIFAGRYVDVINEDNTYRLFMRILNLFGIQMPRPGVRQEAEEHRDKQDQSPDR